MRLIHASDYASLYPGSFIPMVRAVLRLGLERGLRAEAVFLEGPEQRPWIEDLRGDGIAVRFVPSGGLEELLAADDDEPTILHVHFSGLQIEAARAARGRDHIRLWWHVHTPLHPGAVAWTRNAVRFGLLGRATEEILCVAPDLADEVRRRLGPRRKVEFFPNAIDLERFRPLTPEDRRAARERLGIPQDARVLTHFGHDWLRKGGDLYSGAMRELAGRHDDLIATTFMLDGETGGLVRRLDPTPRVEDVYAAADAFVSPSRAEGMPFAVTEALACGTPVVASDIPGQRYVCEGHAGCRLVGLDESELARAIDELLTTEPEELAARMAGAREWIERNMDVRVWAERLFERYAAAGALT